MTPTRLLAACVLLCSGLVFAQENRATPGSSVAPTESEKTAVSSEPWSISPNLEATANVPQDPLARLETSEPPKYRNDPPQDKRTFFFPSPGNGFVISPGALADNSCFAIRSYVMARDRKDSDSTHLAGYTTCVPSSKYHVRTVVGTSEMTPATVVSK
jgi:hypothetical protein